MSYGEIIENSAQRLQDLTRKGSMVVGYLYPHTPIELLMAHGLTPSLIRVNPSVVAGFEDSLQTFSCAFTRNIFSQRANGNLLSLSGVLFPGNTCDALQNVADVWRFRFPGDKILRVTYPATALTEHAVDFLANEFRFLSDNIAKMFDRQISATELADAASIVNDFREAMQFLYAARVYDSNAITYSELVSLLRKFLTAPDRSVVDEIAERFREIRQVLEKNGHLNSADILKDGLLIGNLEKVVTPPSNEFPRIVVVGGMVEPQAIASIVNNLDGVSDNIIALDLLSFGFKTVFTPKTLIPPANKGTKPIGAAPEPSYEGPFKAMARAVLQAPLEPTQEGLTTRTEFLKQLLTKIGVQGLVVCEQSFCDPDEFEAPSLEKAAEKAGIPSLRFPIDPELSDRGRLEGRLQTFLETIGEV
ncbi:MAG: 2-hydroxyacyl-CoA dehydratase [Candidatus Thorarchaeota archaeon]|nr:2-hydroxyacyl-CoA dehydratase [Candidatus Thorarchaeota archaeon]MCK5238018.1 2-hydroxyacyl-CoA dehydratase [Candidatus Thorarchaeota archaeon]